GSCGHCGARRATWPLPIKEGGFRRRAALQFSAGLTNPGDRAPADRSVSRIVRFWRENAGAAKIPCASTGGNYAQTAMTMRYRVFDPETPRDLHLELVQEWQSEVVIEPGMSWEMDD